MDYSGQKKTKYHQKTAAYCYPNNSAVEHEAVTAVEKNVFPSLGAGASVGDLRSREV
jgi:hypothetical protein